MAHQPTDVRRQRARKLFRTPFAQNSPPQVVSAHPKLTLLPLEDRVTPAITGLVFQDYNANGEFDTNRSIPNTGPGTVSAAVDRGVGGVTVTAFNAAGAVAGTAVSNAAGQYTLTPNGTGPFRVEFTGLPTGFFYGPAGVSLNTAVQFVASADAANVNLGLVRAEDYSPDDPILVTNRYVFGGISPADPNVGTGVVVSAPYSAGAAAGDPTQNDYRAPTTHDLSLRHDEVGTTWGLAYDQVRSLVYAAAYMKRHTSFGPDGPGAIYKSGTTGTTADLFADLNAIFADKPAGDLNRVFTDQNGNPVPFRTDVPTNGPEVFQYWVRDGNTRFVDNAGVTRDVGWDSVGKIALGGLAVNGDASRMFTVALADRRFYSLPTTGPVNANTVRRFDLPVPASVTGRTAANPLGDLRPFAVEYYRGLVYVGAVNSAESTQNAADLRAYVFAFDPTTNQFVNRNRQATTSEPVFDMRLDYDRGHTHMGGNPNPNFPGEIAPPDPAEWNPWVPTFSSIPEQPFAEGRVDYPQPMLTGLAFDAAGNMVLGLRDRAGDQLGYITASDPTQPNAISFFGVAAGDTLRAFINDPGNLDAAAVNSARPLAGWTLENNGRNPDGTLGTAPQNSGQGPGGGEFYFDDDLPKDPNQPPVGVLTEHDELTLGGVAQVPGFPDLVVSTFNPTRLQSAVNTGGWRWLSNDTGAIRKSYELYQTPFSNPNATFAKAAGIGDIMAIAAPPPIEVGNRVWFDVNENGIQDAGEPGIAGVTVELRGADLSLLATAVTDAGGNYIFSSGTGVDTTSRVYGLNLEPNTNYRVRVPLLQQVLTGLVLTRPTADSSPNGFQRISKAVAEGGIGVINLTTRQRGEADHSFDVGFVLKPVVALGDFVWNDLNNNGVKDGNEPGVAGVTVNLYTADGTTQLGTTTTDAAGLYYFRDLDPATYVVEVVPPAGFTSSTGKVGSATGPYEPGITANRNNEDHGTNQPNGTIRSGAVTLFAPTDVRNPDTTGRKPNDANFTIDFGLIRPMSIGDTVWLDNYNDGVKQADEPGIGGVTVNLRDGTGNLVATQTTNAAGGYLFSFLSEGQYRVEVVRASLPSSDLVSSTGKNASLTSGPFEPAPGNTGDGTDHGTTAGAVVQGPIVTLAYGAAPVGEAPAPGGLTDIAADADSDRTQDFGFFRPLAIGNLVWRDTNNSGRRDADEPGLANVPVRLFDATTGSLLASTTTAGDGTYLFTGLTPGPYVVEITRPGGLLSSSGTGPSGPLTGPFEPAQGNSLTDNEDHGTQTNGNARTNPVTLGQPGSAANPDNGGLANLRQDFGLFELVVPPPPPPPVSPLASVSGYVYRDINQINGQRQPENGETGIPGTLITLTGVDEQGRSVTLTTTTNMAGFYQFTNLVPGNYTISETQPNGFIDGIDTVGSLGGTNPRNDVLTVTLRPDDHGVEYNFGEILPAAIFGFVYEDLNRNRIRDAGEPGIPNTTITLSGTAFDGTILSRPLTAGDSPVGLVVQTDANGRYEFPLLPVGTYTVVETQPVGYADFYEAAQEPVARPVVIGNDIFSGVVAGPLETRGALNFGEVRGNQVLPEGNEQPSKRDLLGSTDTTVVVPPTSPPPVVVNPAELPTNPPFAVLTGDPTDQALVVTASGEGRSSLVRAFNYATGVESFRFLPYESSYTGGVRVAAADVTGDGTEDIVTATGIGGGPRVRVFDGRTGAAVMDYFAYESGFRGGVFVAAADVTGDGKADIITGTEVGGGPRVTVFDAATGQVVRNFFAFDTSQRGGVRVAAADYNGDGHADIVVSTGAGVPTRVRVFDGLTGAMLTEFAPYDPGFTGGVFVAAGNVLGGAVPDIVTSADEGGGPHVQVFRGLTGQSAASFFAYEPTYTGGARVATVDVNGDGRAEIVTTPGPGRLTAVRIFSSSTLQPIETFAAFDSTYTGGVYVG